MKEISQKNKRFGYRRIHILLKREGLVCNQKRTERIYKEEDLSIKKRSKKRFKCSLRISLSQPKNINEIWAMDFVSDSLYNGRRFRTLNIIDIKSRECLDIEVDTSI